MNSQDSKVSPSFQARCQSDKKYQDYKKRIREIEQENDNITSQLAKARHHIKRLRVERIVLLEEIDELRQGGSHRARIGKKPSLALIGSSGGPIGGDSDSEMSISESIMSDVKGITTTTSNPRKNASATPRKKRDPNAPKGPGNVFFLYCRMERDNIKDEVPNESLGEVTRLLGQKWKALGKEQKQKYYDIYKREMDEYEEAMKEYKAAGGGLEGAAAVEAAANKLKEQKDEDDEEFDMLQDDEEEEEDDDDDEILEEEEVEEEEEEMESQYLKEVATTTSNQSTPMPETPTATITTTL